MNVSASQSSVHVDLPLGTCIERSDDPHCPSFDASWGSPVCNTVLKLEHSAIIKWREMLTILCPLGYYRLCVRPWKSMPLRIGCTAG